MKDEIGRAVNGVILQVSILISEILLVLGILSFLLYLQPLMTLFAVIYFYLLIFFSFLLQKNFYMYGVKIDSCMRVLDLKLIQTFNGIKEIKLNSSENEFIIYYNHSKLSVTFDGKAIHKCSTKINVWNFFYNSFCCIRLYNITLWKKLIKFCPYNWNFRISAFKLLPSSNKILNCFQLIRYHLPSFYVIKKELNLKIDKGIINTNNLIFLTKFINKWCGKKLWQQINS